MITADNVEHAKTAGGMSTGSLSLAGPAGIDLFRDGWTVAPVQVNCLVSVARSKPSHLRWLDTRGWHWQVPAPTNGPGGQGTITMAT